MRPAVVWMAAAMPVLAGCGTPHAAKVNCRGPLQPINVQPAGAPLADRADSVPVTHGQVQGSTDER